MKTRIQNLKNPHKSGDRNSVLSISPALEGRDRGLLRTRCPVRLAVLVSSGCDRDPAMLTKVALPSGLTSDTSPASTCRGASTQVQKSVNHKALSFNPRSQEAEAG